MEKEVTLKMEELVLAKSSLSASRAEINALSRRASELEELNSKLREHILLRDSFERNMDKEYKNQLAQKDEVIRKLAALSTEKAQAAGIPPEAKPEPESAMAGEYGKARKEEELQRLQSLADHYRQRSSAQENLSAQMSEQLNEKNSTIQRLKAFVTEREKLSQEIEEQLQKELAEKEEELSGLKRTGSTRSRTNASERKELEQARQELKLKDAETRRLMLEITGLNETRTILERKLKGSEEYLHKLRQGNEKLLSHLQNRQHERSEEEALRQSEGQTQLEKKLHEKDEEIGRFTQYYTDKEQAYEAVQMQLSEHLKEKNREIQTLKSFVAEREELSQKVEEQLQKEMAVKESELRELRHTKSHGNALVLQRQLEHTAQIIKIKDAANRKLMLELASHKETVSSLLRKLKDEQTHAEGMKAQYEKIIRSIKEDNERITKGLIEDYNSRVATAKTESERIRSELSAKESELQIHKRRIDEAIREFSIRAQQVISMRESIEPIEKAATQAASQPAPQTIIHPTVQQQATETQNAQPEQAETATKAEFESYAKKAKAMREALYKKDSELAKKESELNQKDAEIQAKEREVKAMISTAEQRLKELDRREDSAERKEQILLKQQEAFNRELQTLEAAGSRLMTVESELESQLKAQPAKMIMPAPTAPVEAKPDVTSAVREAPQQPETIAVLEPIQQKIVSPTKTEEIKPKKPELQKPEPKPAKPSALAAIPKEKLAAEQAINLEEQTLGYSEVEEIMAMIDVALQHGENIEQIKNSLLSSGYSKENVEKAVKRMNL